MNIAFFLDNFFPQINGVVTSSLNSIVELSRRGHSVFIIAPDAPLEEIEPFIDRNFDVPTEYQKGFPAHFYPDFQFTYPFCFKTIKKLKNFKPDIIHFHAPFTLGYQAIKLSRKLKIPVLGTFHTFFAEPEYLSLIGMEDSKFLMNFGWWYSNQFFNRCDAVISPGICTSKFLFEKNLKNKVYRISNGVDIEKYKNIDYDKTILNIKINDHEEWIIYIGRISKEKSLDILIEAVNIVMSKRKNVRLLIVGDGPYKDELQKITYNKKINNKVHFTGIVPNKDLLGSGILKKMKLFATASTSENQPMTIIESIMFGLPIIGVDARGVPELIEGNGFIVNPNKPIEMANKIELILKNKELHKKFSDKSLELREKYNIRKTTQEFELLYNDLIMNYLTGENAV